MWNIPNGIRAGSYGSTRALAMFARTRISAMAANYAQNCAQSGAITGVRFNGAAFAANFHSSSRTCKDSDPDNTLGRLRDSGKIDPVILETIDNLNFRALTKVQDASIVPAIENDNGIVVRAKTGTGKTLSYLIPILNDLFPKRTHSLKNKHRVFHLIIVPTRDLAQQIEREFTLFCKGHPELKTFLSRIDVLTGSTRSHLESLFSPSVVVATPGRLKATLGLRRVNKKFRDVKTVILDEADRLLDNGFGPDIEEINELLKSLNVGPQRGQDYGYKQLLYSATVDENVANYAKDHIGEDYEYINCVNEEDTEAHENINQVLVKTNSVSESLTGALATCVKRLQAEDDFKALLFLPTVRSVDWFYDTLKKSIAKPTDRKVFLVHGGMTQAARHRNILGFRRSRGGILVCTDVAARGLDFPDITTVIQCAASAEVASYIHKIGRTGRAGKKGEAILFSSRLEKKYVQRLVDEKQIEFNETRDYTEFDSDFELLNFNLKNDMADEALQSLCLFYNQVSNTYRFKPIPCFEQVLQFAQAVKNDPDVKLNVNPNYLKVMSLSRDQAKPIFDVPSWYNHSVRAHHAKGGSKLKFHKFDKYKSDTRDSRSRDFRGSGSRDFRGSGSRDFRGKYAGSDNNSRNAKYGAKSKNSRNNIYYDPSSDGNNSRYSNRNSNRFDNSRFRNDNTSYD